MALWTIHHWADPARGLAELRRVASTIVVVAPSLRLNDLWLSRDYFPAMTRTRRPEMQPERIAETLGGHVRVGLEDNLFLDKGVLAPSNAALVRRAREIVESLGGSVATAPEVRAMLGLKAARAPVPIRTA